MAARTDYAFPLAIAPVSGQLARSPYPEHVGHMVRQVLLTSPGERANLPEFGCGLRQLLFAPRSDAQDATTRMLVQESLARWLAGQIVVREVAILPSEAAESASLVIRIDYELVETRTAQSVELTVR